jgi:hypothetical protein
MQRSLLHLSGSESCVPPVNSERHVMPQFPNAFPVIISLPTIFAHSFRNPTCTSPYPQFLGAVTSLVSLESGLSTLL